MKFEDYIIQEAKVQKGSLVDKTPQEFDKALKSFLKGAQAKIDDNYKIHYQNLKPDKLVAKEGPRYIKIVTKHMSGSGESAWAFIDKGTGQIYKPASWKAPAKHARGSIFDQDNGMRSITAYGPHYLR